MTPAVDLSGTRIGFIGAGQMAEALALGFVNKASVPASNIYATALRQKRKDDFAAWGANACDSNAELVSKCDVIFVAVKTTATAEAASTQTWRRSTSRSRKGLPRQANSVAWKSRSSSAKLSPACAR